jgi:hypothetical protein
MPPSDATVVLPSQRPTILGNEAGMATKLGVPLRARLSDMPIIKGNGEGPEIVIDIGDGIDPDLEIGDDGSVTMLAPAVHGTGTQDESKDFGENLAITMGDADLARLASDVSDGVESDIQSRSGWTEQYTKGIDLLSLRNEEPGQSGVGQRGISRVGHPLLIEAMVKYGASAEGEMLPAAGPAKVSTIGRVSVNEELRASDFADDMNYLLTEVMTEYYPDTSGMLMNQGYCGLGYKKIYKDPIRQRPTSESILAPDMIVSEEATDLDSALRRTHSIQMMRGQLARMQLVGQYRKIDLGMPTGSYGIGRQAQRAINLSVGITESATRPQDQPYEIWETDTEIDVDDYKLIGHYEKDSPWGMPLPYKITIDRQSKQVLGIWRNWRPEDQMYKNRNMYVKFGLVPGLGYHNWGFLQLLGNQTRALRSCWRLLIDAGMFSNFPGGIKLAGVRTSTNEIAPRPGEWVDIDIKGLGPNADIRKLAMAMPYKEPSQAFVQLIEIIKNDAMRLGSTVQLEVGEGRANMPVGTVLAMIEQQIQVMAAVHKRNHRAQKEELRKIRELFAEDPEQLNRLCRDRPRAPDRDARLWAKAEEFTDLNLVPASDPNAPSRTHSIMLANVLVMLAQQVPQLMDMREVLSSALSVIGADPDRYIVQPDQQAAAPPAPDPKVTAATIQAQQKQQDTLINAQVQTQKIGLERDKLAADTAAAAADNETQRQLQQTKTAGDVAKASTQANNDRAASLEQITRQGNVDAALAAQKAGHDSSQTAQQAGHDAIATAQKTPLPGGE